MAEPRTHVQARELAARFGGRVARIPTGVGLACPHRAQRPPGCVFCRAPDNRAFASEAEWLTDFLATRERLSARYDAARFLASFQVETPTALAREALLTRFRVALGVDGVVGIVLSTRPDGVDEALLAELAALNREKPVFLELGLQSCHDRTLRRLNRGHDFAAFLRALERAAGAGLSVGAHLILGLPGESRDDMLQSARLLAPLPLDSLKFHHLQILSHTALEADWRAGGISVFPTLAAYLNTLVAVLRLLPWRMTIQRVVATAPPTALLAPRWGVGKQDVMRELESRLEALDARQGDRAGEPVI